MLGLPVALLAFGFPFAGFLALLDRRPRRLAGAALAAGIPLLLALLFPGGRFFVLAAALSLAAALGALLHRERVGYAELSLCVLGGLAAAAAIWALVRPEFFPRLSADLEQAALAQGHAWLRWMGGAGGRDARARLLFEEAVTTSAEWSGRVWPAASFAALWIGSGSALALAARWAGGDVGLAVKARAAERCALFRLPELWVWIFLAGVVAFLLVPAGSPAHGVALNVALVAAGLYAWQGFAIALYYLERRAIRPAGRVLWLWAGLLLVPLPLLVFALGLGLADIWFDLRSRMDRPRPPRA